MVQQGTHHHQHLLLLLHLSFHCIYCQEIFRVGEIHICLVIFGQETRDFYNLIDPDIWYENIQ